MTYNEKAFAFIGKWLDRVQTKPGEYAVGYAYNTYKSNPQKLTLYKAYCSYNETMAESIFAPSKEAHLDDNVLEKELFDTLNELKEKVDHWHASKKVNRIVDLAKDFLKEDGYDTSVLNIRLDDTAKWVTIRATATDGPRKFVVEKVVTYEEVLKLCDPVDALVTIMGDLIEKAESKIGDDMETAEAIIIIKNMLEFSQLLPWQKEALDVIVKTMEEGDK
jgi:hypothetical protein